MACLIRDKTSNVLNPYNPYEYSEHSHYLIVGLVLENSVWYVHTKHAACVLLSCSISYYCVRNTSGYSVHLTTNIQDDKTKNNQCASGGSVARNSIGELLGLFLRGGGLTPGFSIYTSAEAKKQGQARLPGLETAGSG